jgi:hypothetical protein
MHTSVPGRRQSSNPLAVQEGCNVEAAIFESVEVWWVSSASLQLGVGPVEDRLDLDNIALDPPWDRHDLSHPAPTSRVSHGVHY